eukprot:scpid44120/ scgid28950/ 
MRSSLVILVCSASILVLAGPLAAGSRSCAERGFTTCHNVCCGRDSKLNESACCLEENAVCCNRPDLYEDSTRFFCCPPDLPKCDFTEGTCRPAGYQLPEFNAQKVIDERISPQDAHRAHTRKPRSAYRGTGFSHSATVLNEHLRRNVERHGFKAQDKLRNCHEFRLDELHSFQRTVLQHRSPALDDMYQGRKDNRRLRHGPNASLDDHKLTWKEEMKISQESPEMHDTIRDGHCHEAVMWFVHQLSHKNQPRVLRKVGSIPLLPENEHFENDAEEKRLVSAGAKPETVQVIKYQYLQSVGCGVCHQVRPGEVESLPYDAKACPVDSAADRCMILHRLNCNDSSEFADQRCCEGLSCWPVYLPASDVAFGRHTTRCDPTWKVLGLKQPGSESKSAMREQDKAKVTLPSPNPPLFAASWSATGKYFNITEDPESPDRFGTSTFYFQEFGAADRTSLRVDFGPVCPFKQLWDAGLEANYAGPCSVIFRNSTVTYVFPHSNTSCVYCERNPFRAWHRDQLCTSQPTHRPATLDRLDGEKNVQADLWEFEWWWNIFLVFRNYRNIYFKPGTNIPLRFEEDLDTGYVDLYNYTTYESPGLPDSVFTDPLKGTEMAYIAGFHKDTAPCNGPDERDIVKRHHQPKCIIFEPLPTRKNWWPIPNE